MHGTEVPVVSHTMFSRQPGPTPRINLKRSQKRSEYLGPQKGIKDPEVLVQTAPLRTPRLLLPCEMNSWLYIVWGYGIQSETAPPNTGIWALGCPTSPTTIGFRV